MIDHLNDRNIVIAFLKQELVGPSPKGEEIDCSVDINITNKEDFYKLWRQKGSNEEILQRDIPVKRYGIGVLYPRGVLADISDVNMAISTNDVEDKNETSTEAVKKALEANADRIASKGELPDPDDFDVSTANAYRQSSMGISFLAEIPSQASLVITACGGRYKQKKVTINGYEKNWWLRSPVNISANISAKKIKANIRRKIYAFPDNKDTNLEGLNIHIEIFIREQEVQDAYLITVCIVNRKESKEIKNEDCLFQTHFNVEIISPQSKEHILPYPGPRFEKLDDEEKSLELLYRKTQTFAIGHGCAADWQVSSNGEKGIRVIAECLPQYETPSITPAIKRKDDDSEVEVSMKCLAGLVEGDNGFGALQEVIYLYEEWLKLKEGKIQELDTIYQETAKKHMSECNRCLQRMKDGMAYLQSDSRAMRAFQLANYAILLQQLQPREPRFISYDEKTRRIAFSKDYKAPNPEASVEKRGAWRAFQAAFLLMAIPSTASGEAPDRETVELIWFPTGGGKTEAYLGLTAFAVLLRRLKNQEDIGVHVLMRYTLRLLTAQQFQRASGLICSMEYLRRRFPEELGDGEFSIGIWLGSDTTPNKKSDALTLLKKLSSGDRHVENKFLVTRCPWCGAQIGPVKHNIRNLPRVIGYESKAGTVVLKCSDTRNCEFGNGLPIYVIDEDIYDKRPSLIIGTIDKFATLAWKQDARRIFGIGSSGEREVSPPGLIIQDELHLISGPLGSMVGLYEAVVEELCIDRRSSSPVPPKIVCSTATIRRYVKQITDLYAREEVALFPPPGLEANDSFFARYAIDKDGKNKPGRMYIGIHAPGLGSLQTVQVRTFTSLLQAPVSLSAEERDPWWTLLLFFNSLRELGTTLSLFQSDIPDYFDVIQKRLGIDFKKVRNIASQPLELTGRIRSDEIPEKISDLEVSTVTKGRRPVDVCLASNIIEVGIDIDRLSLMAVIGQPKTTSQYIQVTGRVGRRWWERPGLVATIYTASKPRDRSHFEKFRSYHERLYAQVEPTSVTPFSPPALDRALHAVMVAYIRQVSPEEQVISPYPIPIDLLNVIKNILVQRAGKVDEAEQDNLISVFDKRVKEWQTWERKDWYKYILDRDASLLRMAGAYVSKEHEHLSWPTPTSMRNVDAECQAEITTLYQQLEGEENA